MTHSKTLVELLADNVSKAPDTVWLKDLKASGSDDWTWREAQDEISAIASWLSQTLDAPGQNISILSRNRAHWVMADMAIVSSANISVPMFTTQSSAIAEYIFEFTDVKVLFVGEADNWEKIQGVIPDDVVIVTFPGVEVDAPALKWDDLVSQHAGQSVSFAGNPDDLMSIVFTSGTTGKPKGVMQTHNSMTLPVVRSVPALELVENPRLISYLPLSHIAERQAVECHSLMLRGVISFIESPATLVRDLQRIQPTFFFAAPRILELLQQAVFQSFGGREAFNEAFESNKKDAVERVRAFLGFQNLTVAMSGSAPLSTSLLSFYRSFGLPILEGFGQTEAMSVILNRADAWKLGSIGKPIGDVEAKITEDGELLVRGPGFATGYYKQPKETAETFVDGWVHTGDRARIDEDGFIFLTGRIKDYFKTIQGKYVAPGPIEDELGKSPYLEQLCLIGRGCSKTALVCVPNSEGRALSRDAFASSLTDLITSVNDSLTEKHARIGVALVSESEWAIENGFLTTTLKIKRPAIDDAFLEIAQKLATDAAVQKQVIVEWV